MRHTVIGIAMFVMATVTAPSLSAQAIEIFQLSGRGTTTLTKQMPDDATGPAPTITLDWGQPHLRGRVLHEDGFIPYDEVWRTGANATTTLATDFDLMFGNRHIAKGRYAVFTLPTREGWFLILQKDVDAPDAGDSSRGSHDAAGAVILRIEWRVADLVGHARALHRMERDVGTAG
jgi:hypothetical protein